MSYPALIIDKSKLKENAEHMLKLCESAGAELCAVTKGFLAAPEIVQTYIEAGVKAFADSRVENLKKMPYAGIEKWLIRIPMLCEAREVALYADVSLNSELGTIKRLSEEALKIGKKHGVVLMIDVGDLREGVLPRDALEAARHICRLEGVRLVGVGVNLNCYGGIIPTNANLSVLLGAAREIERELGVRLRVVSGGNSGTVYMLMDGTLPKGINHLRVGEAILYGWETSYQRLVPGMHHDVFRLEAQIVELKEKPSVPIGESGLNAFGEKVVFEDKGMMMRAIVAVGRQDVRMDDITALDGRLEILGQSSDHMIVDVTRAAGDYKLGGVIGFGTSYGALLSLCTSEYVKKTLI